jgi:diguanylate cyclase (GGDEF)-like protein
VFGIVIRMAGAIEQDRERAQAQLAHQALHDPLTGLANRQLFVDRLTRAAERTERRGGSGPALLFLDVDQFKAVNDTFGHQAGDELLTKIALRLDAVVRTTDTLARLGGDEFVVLCEETCDAAALDAVMERIVAVFDEPFAVGPHLLHLCVSVGIASASDGLTSAEDLLRAADASMYAAKAHRADGTVPPPDDVAPSPVGGHAPVSFGARSPAPAS